MQIVGRHGGKSSDEGGRKVTDDLRLDLDGAQYIMYTVQCTHSPQVFS